MESREETREEERSHGRSRIINTHSQNKHMVKNPKFGVTIFPYKFSSSNVTHIKGRFLDPKQLKRIEKAVFRRVVVCMMPPFS